MEDHIAQQISQALLTCYSKEIHIIIGKHIQRDGTVGVYRFLPDRTKATLVNDINTFTEHFIVCCRGAGFGARITETDKGGVNVNILSNINPALGSELVQRA